MKVCAQSFDQSRLPTYDWAHVYLVNGLFALEFGLLNAKLKPHGVTYSDFHQYLQLWSWPVRISSRGATGKDCCSIKRAAASLRAGVFKHTASEALSIYRILCTFVVEALLPTGVEKEACDCFVSLCAVLDMLTMVPRGVIRAAVLQAAIERHLASFRKVYGEEHMIPKHHLALHLADMLAKHTTLVSCLTHERKHRIIKRFAGSRCNLKSFEVGLLSEILCAQVAALSEPTTFPAGCVLCNPKAATPKVAAIVQMRHPQAEKILIAHEAFISEVQSCSRKDVVLLNDGSHTEVGEVWFHCSIDGAFLSCVSVWEMISPVKWRCRKNPVLVPTATITETLVYSMAGDVVTVLPPPRLR
jgi:hypothetical protein